MSGLVLAFIAIASLSQLGVETTSLAAIITAAVMIILFCPFKIGDFVEAGEKSGTVEGISIPYPQRGLHVIDGDAALKKKAA